MKKLIKTSLPKKKAVVVKKTKPIKTSPCVTSPNDPHQCAYQITLWSTMLRGLEVLEKYYEQFKEASKQEDKAPYIYLGHVREIASILKPIHLAYPHFVPQYRQQPLRWAITLYDGWLETRNIDIEKKFKI